MKIQKRNGQIVEFDTQKIITAIQKAAVEVGDLIPMVDIQTIVFPIVDVLRDSDEIFSVEDVQDLIEEGLMDSGYKKVAKAYIIYRARKAVERNKGWEMTDLQRDILQNKYFFENEGFNAFVERVGYQNSPIQKMIRDKKFLPAGRILMGRRLFEHGKKVTYSNCFSEDAEVLTENGYKNIAEVKIGDLVLTEDGKLNPVNAVLINDFEGEMIRFSSPNLNDSITATPNHPFLTQEGWKTADEIYNNNKKDKNKKLRFASIIPERVAKIYPKVKVGEVLISTNLKQENGFIFSVNPTAFYNGSVSEHRGGKMFSEIQITEEVLYLLGRYLGDGSVTKRSGKERYSIFQIVFNAQNEVEAYDKCKGILENSFGVKVSDNSNEDQNTLVLKVNSEVFGELINYLTGAKENKHFPDGFKNDLNVLLGFFDADGVVLKNGAAKIALANENLIQEVQDSLRNNGFNTKDYLSKKTTNGFNYYELYIGKPIALKLIPLLTKKYQDERHLLSPSEQKTFVYFNRIEKVPYSDKVYNLSVENNHTYVVNGAVVHNCFVITPPEDNIESIFDTAKKMARTYSYGGGCGTSLEKLRPRRSKVNNSAKETTGAVSFMDLYSMTTGLIGQQGRRGALMLSMPVEHPDIIEFINVKTDLSKVTFANISVMISDKFMEAVKADEMWHMEFTVKDTGEVIKRKTKAKDLMRLIAKNNWNYAEPGMLFWDRVKNYHINSEDPTFEYASTNPCGEKPLPKGGSCLLGSINFAAYVKNGVFDFESFDRGVRRMTAYLDDVLEEGLKLLPLEEQIESVAKYRQIGGGIMGLADALILMGLRYGSKESLEISEKIGSIMANAALQESAIRAGQLGTYPAYNWEYVKKSPYLKAIATPETWALIKKYGLRNAEVLSIAPTGSISTMLGVSGGIEPIFQIFYVRESKTLNEAPTFYKVYTPVAKEYMDKFGITDEKMLPDFFVTSATLNYRERVDMQAVWQKYVDAAISSTVNVPYEFTVEEVEDMYTYAWEKGLKGITLFRDGGARVGILTTENDHKEKEVIKDKITELPPLFKNPHDKHTCPECGGKMMVGGGCEECQDCGYSPCSI